MKKLHEYILRCLRKSIVDDLDVNNGVIEPLRSQYILRDEDVKEIEAGVTPQDRANILLNILPRCGPYAFDIFRQSLTHHYPWLKDNMDIMLETGNMSTDDMGYSNGYPVLRPVSPMKVIREEKIKQLVEAFESLKPKGYVVLHGMKGFGKSCLTASTLDDTKLIKNLFNNKVYWLEFGNERTIDEEILNQLNALYHLVRNLEILPESLKPEPLKDALIRFLKGHFNKESHSLLILDDVWNKKIIDTFDFECKTLVITADLEVLNGRPRTVIKMTDGFTEAETLGLFANVLDVRVDELPSEAKRIHEECNGMPLLISMFSAQFEEFKDDMRNNSQRWKYYLESLRRKDTTNKVIKKFFEKQETVFEMCIEQLPPELKDRYKDLAIFAEDVNIMPKTLEILWKEHLYKVDETMLEFCHKSLAAKQWNSSLGIYVYGVHDLLLCYLRKKQHENLVHMHRSFIEKYSNYCNGDFSKLQEDNYIYSYIGYHLEQGQMYDLFPKLYLDFDFIQTKIFRTGLSDLLIDLQKFRKYITKNDDKVYKAKLIDLEKFLEEHASIIAKQRDKECLDIIQIAMNYSYQGYISDSANELAVTRSQNLYLYHNKATNYINRPLSEEFSMKICTSTFTDNCNLILIGNATGEIILWDSVNRKQKTFHGHNKETCIKKIIVSDDDEYFLSLSEDGTAKLFTMKHDETLRFRKRFEGIFKSKTSRDDSTAQYSIDGEAILDIAFGYNDEHIAACTNKGRIHIWDRNGKTLCDINCHPHNNLKHITFSMERTLLHVMDEINGVVITYKLSGTNYTYVSQYNPQLKKEKIIFFRNIPGRRNSLMIVTEVRAVYVMWVGDNQLHSYSKQEKANVENDKTVYVCAALTDDGLYLVLADSEDFINVWNIDAGYQPIITYKSRVLSLDTYWSQEGYHIICGSENKLFHRWKFLEEKVPMAVRKPHFDAVMRPFGKNDIIANETIKNAVLISDGNDTIAESDPTDGKIVNLSLSPDGEKVVYVSERGTVTLYTVENKKAISILTLSQPTGLVKILNVNNHDIVVCREENDLKVWENVRVMYLVENMGCVISIHTLSKSKVVTVTQNGVIIIWHIDVTNWSRISKKIIEDVNTRIEFSCLSQSKGILVVLRDNHELIVHCLSQDTTISPAPICIDTCFKQKFPQKPTCCEISYNEQYLAVGFTNGDISIVDILKRQETRKLLLHNSTITQLHWAPLIVDAPILLSVNGDELVWWNIALASYNSNPRKPSRMRLSYNSNNTISASESLTSSISSSRSIDSAISSMQLSPASDKDSELENRANSISKYWKSKAGKDYKRPELLSVVQLPLHCVAKVCISPDFSKFLTVDVYGSINTFKLFGYT